MMRPGSAPTYVRRWPRISASSRMPPRRDAHELAAERLGDRAAEARLADAGRPDEAQDRAAVLLLRELAHRHELEDALLHLRQAVVVRVEHLRRVARGRGGRRSPSSTARDVSHSRYVRMMPTSGDADGIAFHAAQLVLRLLAHVLGHAGGGDALAQVVGVARRRVGLAQLALDRLHLLAQEVLALRLVELLLHARVDLALQLEHVQLFREMDAELLEPLARRRASRGGPAASLVVEVQRRGDVVGEPARLARRSSPCT